MIKRQGKALILVLLLVLGICAYFAMNRGSSSGDFEGKKFSGSIEHKFLRGKILLSLALKDESGNNVKPIRKSNGKRMQLPKVELLDEKGDVITSFRMRYG